MEVSNITAWIKKDTLLEPASVPMAFRIGACTFFLIDDEAGIEKLDELIAVIQKVREVGPEVYQAVVPQEVEDMELIEDGE
jgi:hypothetical protein